MAPNAAIIGSSIKTNANIEIDKTLQNIIA
jgi:hypothetical protein